MANFAAYALTEHYIGRLLRKAGQKAMSKKVLTDSVYLNNMLLHSGHEGNSPEVQCHATEMIWKAWGRNAIFIRDMDTLNRIGNLRCSDFDPLTLPHGSWLIAMPKAAGVPSFMFSITSEEEWRGKIMAHDKRINVAPASHVSYKNGVGFTICFRMKGYTFLQNSDATTFNAEYKGELTAKGIADSALTEEENKLIYELKMFALKLMIYQMAFPDHVQDAPPNLQATTKPVAMKRYQLGGIGGDNSLTAVGLHLRQLRAPRYYQGDYRDKPVGSRFVEVKPYVRGAKKVKTVEVNNDSRI